MAVIERISVESLLINLTNPRHEHQSSQREAIRTLAIDQGIKLVNLAADIVEEGLNPSDIIMVMPAEQEGAYIVMEGNRRVVALKLLASLKFLTSIGLPAPLEQRYRSLQNDGEQKIPNAVYCAVLSSDDPVDHWIQVKHTGENDGIGTVRWDGVQTERFRGDSPWLQAVELVRKSRYIDDETRKKLPKISITNIQRVLKTPEARKTLGFDVRGNQLVIIEPNEEVAIARMAIMVSEVANKTTRVSDLDSRVQRVEYAKGVVARQSALQYGTPDDANDTDGAGNVDNANAPDNAGNANTQGTRVTSAKAVTSRRVNPSRKALIPNDMKLTIHHSRINQIYHELQKIKVEEFRNCCAVMLRVFTELSIDHFAQQHSIPLKTQQAANPNKPLPPEKDMTLRQKINAVINYLEQNNLCSRSDLQVLSPVSSVNWGAAAR